ncbi:MAG: sugar-binding transcriptional regulator [Leptolinea sp.]|nr:sugar-binding transcriptional regulator [Leptolinea sp.]
MRNATLARVSSLYFDQNMTQQEIADTTGITRTMVSRIIAEAREQGIVEIKVHFPWRSKHLENELINKFGLQAARVMVMDTNSYSELLLGLGKLTAEYFTSVLHDNMSIGLSWGSAIQHMINALKPRKMKGVEVIQLIGASGLESNLSDGPLLAQLLTNRLNASCRYLHAPLIVENKIVRDALLEERSIKETIKRASQADIALVGIGSIHPDIYSLKTAGYINEEQRKNLEASGVVGDFCGHHYSIEGIELDNEINDRVVCISLQDFVKIGSVIAVAGGIRKGDAILGALRGKFVNVLVTDAETAEYALEHA